MMEKAITGSVKSIQELYQRTLEIQERLRKEEQERLETGMIHIPEWRDDKRGAPNSFLRSALFAAIQSKDRVDFKEKILFSQDGITIRYTGEQLNQEDLIVWLTLVDLAKQHPLGTECSFTANGILKHMGMDTSGQSHERLRKSILRMTACAVVIKSDNYSYGGSIIGDFTIREHDKSYMVTLNRKIIKLFNEADWTGLEWKQRGLLSRKPLALALHGYYSSHEKPLAVSIEFLLSITGSMNKQRSDFKRKTRTALEELIKINFLKSYEIDDNIVKVERTTKLQK
jgi:TrfA protein